MIDHSRDYDDTTYQPPSWWNTIGGEGPKPYSTKAWTFLQVVIEEEEEDPPLSS